MILKEIDRRRLKVKTDFRQDNADTVVLIIRTLNFRSRISEKEHHFNINK